LNGTISCGSVATGVHFQALNSGCVPSMTMSASVPVKRNANHFWL
jgi:hypothetical protein